MSDASLDPGPSPDEVLAAANDVERRLVAMTQEADKNTARYERRLKVWRLRIMGYDWEGIASQLGIAVATAYVDFRWVIENVPSVIEDGSELRRISVERLELLFNLLRPRLAEGDPHAIRAAVSIIKQQAALMGLQTMQVTSNVKVLYELSGVDAKDDV